MGSWAGERLLKSRTPRLHNGFCAVFLRYSRSYSRRSHPRWPEGAKNTPIQAFINMGQSCFVIVLDDFTDELGPRYCRFDARKSPSSPLRKVPSCLVGPSDELELCSTMVSGKSSVFGTVSSSGEL